VNRHVEEKGKYGRSLDHAIIKLGILGIHTGWSWVSNAGSGFFYLLFFSNPSR
jgi:hypothetical protein